ncbi:MAG TPA: FAD-binding oxidoreductase, partial [Candidatus Sulfotelmatobacter sp.]|nr:FAD-binding oxidoreductase [Candidatus Sulfotelmatobacter sp.]
MITASTIEEKLRSIVGTEYFRAASVSDAVMGVQPQFVVEPASEQELAAVLSCANGAEIAVIPRGGATKLTWGNPPKPAGLILSTARLNRILEHAWADLTVTVEAGCTLQALQEKLAKHGQRLALDGLWPEHATIGGALSTNDSGALRLRFGALRDLIIGVTIALPDGTLASSGGKVVKNVAGYDLPKLTTGALGTLGIITRAIFRLHPAPGGRRTISFAATSVDEMQRQILAIQDSKLAHTALQIRGDSEGRFAADILFEGTEAGLAAEESQLLMLVGGSALRQSAELVWGARQDLWSPPPVNAVIAKLSALPSAIATTIHSVKRIADPRNLHFQYVVQATGIGTLRVEGDAKACKPAIEQIRAELESSRSSLVVLHQPLGLEPLEAWGSAGDAISLMRA